ncbi:class I SAM-dependent methyltransferase [Aquabacterium sp. A7-Y]|nr:DUF938 domain-containing protein [Aquabacterium sp. A7-Y]MCW7538740.1 class I SAM-dependent methyltransferase [Aquabacterium sp. A7-Y]
MTSRLHSPAAERNRIPITEVLRQVLPAQGAALEIASGTGQHVAHFAVALPGWQWQPSDPDAQLLESIGSWAQGLANVLPAVPLDVTAPDWRLPRYDAIFCANMIHIAPWNACLALLRGAAAHLRPEGLLVLYGPYRIAGRHTAPSNQAFDADLRQRDPAWGVRDLEQVQDVAQAQGLHLQQRFEMPANNQCLVFRGG